MLVSVILPSYNHELFIDECINSVLQQTFQDFEIIITDDASTDGTVAKIEKYKDPRIKLFRHSANQGASVASNNCLIHSQGRYIAMMSSDDVWMPEKLEVQVEYLSSHCDTAAVFGKVIWIDEKSEPITDPNFPFYNVFEVNNRSRFEWLNFFFYYGNCLCHPSSLIRRECYEEVGWLNQAMANLPDFDLWVRLCMKYDIYVLDQKLIKFRRLQMEANASGETTANRIRTRYEYLHILDHYLKIQDLDDFYNVFPETDRSNDATIQDIPFLLARRALSADLEIKKLWGQDLIFYQLQDKRRATRIAEHFQYSYIDFIREVACHDIFKITGDQVKARENLVSDGSADGLDIFNGVSRQQIANQENESNPSAEVLVGKNKFTRSRSTGFFSIIHLKTRTLKKHFSLAKDIDLIQRTGFFDTTWYLERNPDVKNSRIDPIKHFLLYGGFEGRDPSDKFSCEWYLDTNEDVRRSGMNPLVHYLKYGISEKRTPKKTAC